MIISNLNHFEEVVAEAPSIVGGRNATVGEVVNPETVALLKERGLGDLLKTIVNVDSVSVKNSNATTSVENAMGETKDGYQIESSKVSSSSAF